MKVTLLRITFLIVIIGIFRSQGQAQYNLEKEDSLKLLLEQPQVDSLKLKILTELAVLYGSTDKEKSINYYLQAISYDMDNFSKARLLNTVGYYYWGLGKFNEAIDHYSKSLSIFNELNDSTRIGMVNNNIASAKWSLGKWNDALQFYQAGLKIRKATNDLKGVSTVLNNIGLIYQDFGVYDEALIYHNNALNIALEINNYDAISYSYSNIGLCYKMKKEFDSALEYHILGFKIYNKNENNGRKKSYYLANIGMVYAELDILDSALYYFEQSLEQAKLINNNHRVAIAENNLGKTYLQIGEIKTAAIYINKSFRLALDNSYQDLLRDNQFALAEIEEAKGNANSALVYFKNAIALRDSLFNMEEISTFAEITIKQIQEKEQNEKSLLNKNIEIQKAIIKEEIILRWILLAGGVLLLLALIYITRSRYSIKKLNTQLLESEKDLKQSNATKDKLFSIIAHDLRSPFNSIIGLSNLLSHFVKDNNVVEIGKSSMMISELSQKAMNLLSNLMEWALSQTGKMAFSPKKLDINNIINENVHFYTDIAKQKSITITNDTTVSVFVNADKDMINTVLRNLISNAIKFTKINGIIQILSKVENNKVKISIRDTGVGLSTKSIEKLFTFDTLDSTLGTQNEKGTGLGLMLCKEFIVKHQGEIWVSSELDKGSEFYFTLPHNTN